MYDLIIIPISLLLLYLGGEGVLKGVLVIARKFKLSNILVSAVIIGFGTSLAELTVSVEAVLIGSPDIALGNIIGSNIANILLVTAIAALITPIMLKNLKINRDIFVMIVASLLLLFFKFIDWLNFYSGVIFLLILFSYISYSYFQDQKDNGDKEENLENFSLIKAIIYSVIGLATLILGGWLLVNSSIKIAQSYGISEAVIGLTIVAVGTAIPELTTTIIASIKKHNDLVIGNILGSNIFNILGILGVTLLIENIPVTDEMMKKGIWEMIAATLFFIIILRFAKSISKLIASFMLTSYAIYIVYLF
ncbi:calcium/sodium antiporter [Candidatus Pelagibacter bacterium]|jgi:cation:H+ antiporter|nr:calcium/sodium antiporter [Candidatus Pelagibacter bacterium]MDC0415742.1 calcium/sodium antiporter [Candidatus Pelagibacter sp.]